MYSNERRLKNGNKTYKKKEIKKVKIKIKFYCKDCFYSLVANKKLWKVRS